MKKKIIIIPIMLSIAMFNLYRCRTSVNNESISEEKTKHQLLITYKLCSDKKLSELKISPDGTSFLANFDNREDFDNKKVIVQMNDKEYGSFNNVNFTGFSDDGKSFAIQYGKLPITDSCMKPFKNSLSGRPFDTCCLICLVAMFKNPVANHILFDFDGLDDNHNKPFLIINDETHCFYTEKMIEKEKINKPIDCAIEVISGHNEKRNKRDSDYSDKNKMVFQVKDTIHGPFYKNNIHRLNFKIPVTIIGKYKNQYIKIANRSFGPYTYIKEYSSSKNGNTFVFSFRQKEKNYLNHNGVVRGPIEIREVAVSGDGRSYCYTYFEFYRPNATKIIIFNGQQFGPFSDCHPIIDREGNIRGFYYIEAEDEYLWGNWDKDYNTSVFLNQKVYGPYSGGLVHVTLDNRLIVAHQNTRGYLSIEEITHF